MQVFRRVILPILYLVVLAVIAASLAWLAFAPSGDSRSDDEFPTGELVGSEVFVERDTIEAHVTVDGSITIAEPVPAKPDRDGTINHIWVKPGMEVEEGDDLFQIVVEDVEEPAAGPDGSDAEDSAAEAPAAPAPRRTYHTITAPVGGTVGAFDLRVGDDVAKGSGDLTVTSRDYSAVADIEPVELYRMGDLPDTAEVTIDRGPAPFDCRELRLLEAGVPPASGAGGTGDDGAGPEEAGMDESGMDESGTADDGSAGSGGSTQLRCAIPDDVQVYNGLAMTLTIDIGSADDVLTVPVTAVRGMGEEATVWVLDDMGEPTERAVVIGMSDGTLAEVKEGLEEGDALLEFVPGTEPDLEEDDFGEIW